MTSPEWRKIASASLTVIQIDRYRYGPRENIDPSIGRTVHHSENVVGTDKNIIECHCIHTLLY